MNPKVLLIGFSLAANVALGAWLAFRSPVPASPAPSAGQPAPAPAPVPVDPLTEPITAATWERLTAAPAADYAARLRAEGLPPAVIRAMLRARISASYADRLKALRTPTGKDEYWRRSPFGFDGPFGDATMTAEARAERRRINREIDSAVRNGLGADGDQLTEREKAMRERNFGTLSPAQVEQISAIQRDYNDLRAQIRDTMQGVTMPEDRTQLRLLDQEERNDLAALLSPAELLEYDLRNSPAASQVRSTTRFFEPTEAEYRALVQLRQEFNRPYGSSNLSEAEQAARRAAEKTYLTQVAGVLSPERYAEYELTANPEFQSLANTLARYNYDLPVAREVMALRQSTTTRAAAIQGNKLYNAEQRAAEQSALYQEVSRQLATKLGDKAYTEFERTGAGGWLRNLRPKTATPGGSAP